MDWLSSIQEYIKRFNQWLTSRSVRDRVQSLLEAQPFLQNVPYWVAATIVGLVAVVYAELIHTFTQMAFEIFIENPYYTMALSPLCFVAAWALVYYFGKAAGGSGIPAVMAGIHLDVKSPRRYLNELMSLRISAVKVLSSVLCVLGGGAIGREGPTIQISTSIFLAIGAIFRKVWPKSTHQPWLIAGGAAGLAAAFNTPLGGIVFAIEELAAQQFNRVKTVLVSAVIISGMVSQWILGAYLFFGYPELGEVTAGFMPWAILIGIICGVGGGFFGKILFHFGNKLRKMRARDQALFAGGVGLFVAFYAFFFTEQVMGGGAEVVRELLFSEGVEADLKLVIGRYVGTLVSYLAGVAGGIFAPSLAIGASIGSQMAVWVGSSNPNLMVLAGMAGFLAAVTRAPFTALVLVLEMTDRHGATLQLMLTSIVAYVVSLSIDSHSFYERRCDEIIAEIEDKEAMRKAEAK
ncbi:MAG: chloride channel protein [Bdellovibrionales bacterium]|nr:chloride channel protein [Bdellovibrionales bacterium]